jgi:hypothetical protein
VLWAIFIVLLVLWGLGIVSSHAIGAFIHVLLVVALAVLLLGIIEGRWPI